jgi:hypothetical protein
MIKCVNKLGLSCAKLWSNLVTQQDMQNHPSSASPISRQLMEICTLYYSKQVEYYF